MAILRSNIASNASSATATTNNNGTHHTNRPITPPSTSSSSTQAALAAATLAAQFNPKLILSQIISLQSFHYLVLGILFQINHVLFGTSITVDRIFTARYLDVWSAVGWVDNAAVLMSCLIGWVIDWLIDWFSSQIIMQCGDFNIILACSWFIMLKFIISLYFMFIIIVLLYPLLSFLIRACISWTTINYNNACHHKQQTQINPPCTHRRKIEKMPRLLSNTLPPPHSPLYHLWRISLHVGLVDHSHFGDDFHGSSGGISL